MDLDFSRFPAQERAWRSFSRNNSVTTLAWGRGAGKSWFARNVGWMLPVVEWDGVQRKPGLKGVRIHHLMPTLEQSRRVHQAVLEAELEGEWAFLGGRLNKSTWCVHFPGGSFIQWITAERAQNQRGIRTDIVTGDEADDLEPDMLDGVVKPFFSEPHSLKRLLLAGTPRRGRKGTLYRYFHDLPKVDPNRFRGIHATCWDAAAAGFVDLQYVKDTQKDTLPEVFSREWECNFDAAEGLVYPAFREDFHVREFPEDIVWDEVIVGADHGYEDPGVILLIGIIGRGDDATAWVIDEVYEKHREPDWWLDKVAERIDWFPRARWYPDSARPDLNKSWKSRGARVQDVNKYAGSLEDGVDCLKRWMHIRKTPDGREFARLYVHPRCKFTIAELGAYRRKRDPRNPEAVLEAIEDKNNHAMDALRYPIFNRFDSRASRKRDGSAGARQ